MFERVSPEEAGVHSDGIVRFFDDMKAKRLHMHAVMILRHGKVIAEAEFAPWSKNNLHMLFSLSKSFTSTAVGFAVQDGLLRLSDRLIDFFLDLLPAEPCENMKKMTLKHLLTMNTGHGEEPRWNGDNWEKVFIRSYVEFEPGTHFLYNTFATYMLAAVVQKVTGKKLLAYLREKLMDPLGMSPDIRFDESPSGVATGGFGLNVRVGDIAKLGQFYLQKGKWDGKQLLGEDWIRDAATPWSDNKNHGGENSDWGSGYGYQFWMCRPDEVFRGDGAYGQYCVVMPGQDMVIAILSGIGDMGAVLDSIWTNILPCVADGPIAASGAENALSALQMDAKTPAIWEEDGTAVSAPIPEEGWLGTYRMRPNSPLGIDTFTLGADGVTLSKGDDAETWALSLDEWIPAAGNPEVAVRAAKTRDGLILHSCRVFTPFETILTLTFTACGVEIRGRGNPGSGEFTEIGYKM
ncbi:MAG: serine hydrolase [Clostridia bacterium]|nr:serine hydrolase [Clostridia bacterium]